MKAEFALRADAEEEKRNYFQRLTRQICTIGSDDRLLSFRVDVWGGHGDEIKFVGGADRSSLFVA
jgi:hypothetical protein